MSLLHKIQADALSARKLREVERGVFLSTLFSEASKPGKDAGSRESTDDEVTATVRKFIKSATETCEALKSTEDPRKLLALEKAQQEIAILQNYLPTQATAEQIEAAIMEELSRLGLDANLKQMGAVMSSLTARFAGNFDKGLASKLVRAALT